MSDEQILDNALDILKRVEVIADLLNGVPKKLVDDIKKSISKIENRLED